MTVRMIASDIDGTLLHADGTMSDRTVAALQAAEDAGITVVLCTGRPPRWMPPIAERTGHTGLAVCANGAVVYDLHTEQVIETFPIDLDVARALAQAIKEALPDAQLAVERADGMWREPAYIPLAPTGHTEVSFEELLTQPMVKIIAKHPGMTSSDIHAATGHLAHLAELTYGGTSIIEISAVGVTKAFGVERLAAELGFSGDDAVAFGDMPNDIPLLSWAGRGVAVANAHPDVIAIADEVCPSNEEDGPASIVERLVGLADARHQELH